MVIGMLKDIRTSVGKNVWHEVAVTIELDRGLNEVEVPENLERGLADAGLAEALSTTVDLETVQLADQET